MRYVQNPPNPWLSTQVDWVGEPPEAALEIFEEEATRTIITHNQSPDVGFDYSVNPYRGCSHACTYCFSRPTHEYLGWGAGTDFERKIVVKTRAPELLRNEFMKRSWKGDEIVFSFTSDPYLPLEAHYKLTRQCLKVCVEFRNPVGIITKSAMIRRDLDLLSELNREASVKVNLTIPFLDQDVARAVEPFAPSIDARFRAMAEIASAGIPVGLAVSPIIPGLNDWDLPGLLERAAEAGATTAFIGLLRLPGSVAPYFIERLREKLPTRAERVLNHVRAERQGRLNSSVFGERMRGRSENWKVIERMFAVFCRRFGLNKKGEAHQVAATFRRPSRSLQATLFD